MNINLNPSVCFGINSLKEAISHSLNEQQRKILIITSIIFGLIAAGYLIIRCCCFKAEIRPNDKVDGGDDIPVVDNEDDITVDDKDDITVDDPNVQRIVEDNLKLIQKDFLKAIASDKENHLGNRYDYECRDHNHNQPLKTIEIHLATFGCNCEGMIKTMEYGYYGSNHKLLIYGPDVRIKKVENDMFLVDEPELMSTTDQLYFCKILIKFTSDRDHNDAPFMLEGSPQPEPIQSIMELMVAKLNKRASQAALVNFNKLERVEHPII